MLTAAEGTENYIKVMYSLLQYSIFRIIIIISAAMDMGWHYLDILDKVVLNICRIIYCLHESHTIMT